MNSYYSGKTSIEKEESQTESMQQTDENDKYEAYGNELESMTY